MQFIILYFNGQYKEELQKEFTNEILIYQYLVQVIRDLQKQHIALQNS